jgi:hypothetical protein
MFSHAKRIFFGSSQQKKPPFFVVEVLKDEATGPRFLSLFRAERGTGRVGGSKLSKSYGSYGKWVENAMGNGRAEKLWKTSLKN